MKYFFQNEIRLNEGQPVRLSWIVAISLIASETKKGTV